MTPSLEVDILVCTSGCSTEGCTRMMEPGDLIYLASMPRRASGERNLAKLVLCPVCAERVLDEKRHEARVLALEIAARRLGLGEVR